MSIPSAVANQLLVDCLHRCCICHVEQVQIHHISYISEEGDNSYDNLIPLCPNCHSKVHIFQAAQGKSGVTVRSITREQLKLYKNDWIQYCKNVIHIKAGLTEASSWHYYWNPDRIKSIWSSLGLNNSYQSLPTDSFSFKAELAGMLTDIEKQKGFWDLSYLFTE